MAVRLKVSKPTTRLSSLSLEKLLKSQKNLSRPPPRLWLDVEDEPIDVDPHGYTILKLTHPLLRTLDSCSGIKQFNQVHTHLIVSGIFQHSLAASRVIKKLSSFPHFLTYAVSVFNCFEESDAFLCNTIIRSYVNFGDPYGALRFYYEHMIAKSVVPNHYTFPLVVKACAGIGSVKEGEKIHCRVLKFGFESDLFVRNSFIHMYSICGKVKDARTMFDAGPDWDLVSWNSMIDGYVKNGDVFVAHQLFHMMPERDSFSWNSMLAGYLGIGDMEAARRLFQMMPYKDVVSWNCMVDGYARTKNLSMALEFFNQMPMRDVLSWNTMLAVYVRSKDYGKCLGLFDMMIEEGDIKPNKATLVSVLTASANSGRLDRGKWVHSYIESNRIKPDVLLSTALLTMYAKCGDMDLARDVFDKMHDKSVVSWNSIIMGYGMDGCGEKALEVFLDMQKRGPIPNESTFISILSACTHAGMVLEGWWCFDLMQRVYRIEPKIEHYGCMVDLLARAGFTKESEELIRKIPMEAGHTLWESLLSACRTHSNLELGVVVAKRLIELKPGDIGPYLLLSHIYASLGKWDDVELVRMMMKEKRLNKEAGSSSLQFGECDSEFLVENGSLHRRNMVYSMLSEIGARLKLSCSDVFALSNMRKNAES